MGYQQLTQKRTDEHIVHLGFMKWCSIPDLRHDKYKAIVEMPQSYELLLTFSVA